MPTVKECAIRLGVEPEHELQRLAQTMVHRATGRLSVRLNAIFRFTNLPEEMQQQVLGHTDLVAPYDLVCGPHSGFCSHKCCERCTENESTDCCYVLYAAFASKCICWKLPKALFRVSRFVRESATRIFYSRNNFIVPTYKPSFSFRNESPAHLRSLQFLMSLPPNAWKHLRYIQWTFPRLCSNYLLSGETASLDWLSTNNFMVRNLDLPKLTLVIDMSEEHYSNDYAYLTPDAVAERERGMWTAYQRTFEPVVRLNRLK